MAIRILAVFTIIFIGTTFLYFKGGSFNLPKGETTILEKIQEENNFAMKTSEKYMRTSTRDILITDGIKHSIPLNEILSGGPSKDGIPSIDSPSFVDISDADLFLKDSSVGLGIIYKGEKRFYPYQILVWHEIVNDTIAGDSILVTYCPLCATGVAYERLIDGKPTFFGVSGKLWQSNLLMYNRSDNRENESLWSQVLGEAVLGEFTGTLLTIVPSDTVLYGQWKKKHPETVVLSRDTGVTRAYGTDPYEDYYTDDTVSFGATFNDDRLHPKEFVLGVEVNGKFKAYHSPALPKGTTNDNFAGKIVTIEKSDIGEVKMFIDEDKTPLPYIGGFWFSWLAVHPETELYK